jgi:hypothetical protein
MCLNLRKAIGRNQLKAYTIAQNLQITQKKTQWLLPRVWFFFFIQLLKYHGLKDRTEECCRDYRR